MCSYNAVNGDFACENKYLLTDVLEKDWKFKGFVLSDWGGTHSTVKASAAGLDNEEPLDDFFGDKLKAGRASRDRFRWLSSTTTCAASCGRSLPAESWIIRTQKSVVDVEGGLETARTDRASRASCC